MPAARASRPSSWRGRALAGVALTVLLASGCVQSSDDFGENRPDDQADPPGQLVPRTPEVLETDLPYTDPPLEIPLPGATGGEPGEVPTDAGEASPGEGDGATVDDS